MYGCACEAPCLLLKVPRSQIFFSPPYSPCSNTGMKKGRLRPTIQCKQKHFSISESFQLCLDALLILFYVCSFFFFLESEVGYLSWTERLFVFLGIEVLCNKIYHFSGKTILFWACIERNFWKWKIWVKTWFKIVIYIRKYSCSSFSHQVQVRFSDIDRILWKIHTISISLHNVKFIQIELKIYMLERKIINNKNQIKSK